MTITTSTSYQLPAQVAMQASLAANFVAFHRFPELFTYTTGNLAGLGSVTLITGIAEFKTVVILVNIAFDAASVFEYQDGTTTFAVSRSSGIGTYQLNLLPFGQVLGPGANFTLRNALGGAINHNTTVWYTSERN